MTLAQIIIFVPAAALVAASPGANNLLAFANGSRRGFIPAVFALSGRCVAFGLMIAMVIVGLGALLEASELAFQVIKWAGVLYLAFLGLGMCFDRSNLAAKPDRPLRMDGAFALARMAREQKADKVVAAYARTIYLDRRRALMEAWGSSA